MPRRTRSGPTGRLALLLVRLGTPGGGRELFECLARLGFASCRATCYDRAAELRRQAATTARQLGMTRLLDELGAA